MSGKFPDSKVGRQLGPYRLTQLIGRGGMGEVYAAEDTRKRRVVALKLISEQFSTNPVFRMRMQREADAAGRLTEPHVVPIHDYGDIDGQFYVDMRLIDGISLSEVLHRDGQLSPPRAVAIVRQIAEALDAAHAIGVTHRDVKPANILITSTDFAYLVDFGISRAASDPGLTQTGMTIGTYYYMAPERFTGDACTSSSDVYALACVLSECLTGAPPFRGDSIERLIGAHLTEAPPRPSQVRPGVVPTALDRVVAKGMAKNPADRYATAGALASDAHDALTISDQHDATTILRHGKQGSLSNGHAAVGGAPRVDHGSTTALYEARPASPSSPLLAGNPSVPAHAPNSTPPDKSNPNGKRTRWIVVGVAATVLAAALGGAAYLVSRPSVTNPSTSSGQHVLQFDGLDFRLSPSGVAVDGTGNVYITSESMYGRVLELTPGSTKPSMLAFEGLYQPQALAVDKSGAVYVTDFHNRVVKLDAGAQQQTVLPFDGLNYPEGVAVDAQGNVFVADRGNNRVVELQAGSNHQTVLPFDGLRDPDGVAVDGAGNVYVADTDNNRLLKLATGSSAQVVMPFTDLSAPWGVAVDSSGNVYATEHDTNKVAKLAVGAVDSTALPFNGLSTPLAVAVAGSGTVYVADRGNDRVVALPH